MSAEVAVRTTGTPDARRLPTIATAQRYGTIVVVGGGCYGAYYVRQLARAVLAGAVTCERVLVVDRDPACRVARDGWDAVWGEPASGLAVETAGDMAADPAAAAASMGGPPRKQPGPHTADERHRLPALVIEIAEWGGFFGRWLDAAAAAPDAHAADAIVPSPLMPHLMYEWLRDRARRRWPGREVAQPPLPRPPATPWERGAPDGTHYVSFAEWMCPINCVEPVLCPAIRGPRSWSMPPAIRAYAAALADEGTPVAGPVLFHCTHRSHGVGMFDVRDVLAADRLVAEAGTAGPAAVLVGTVSHCHGALGLLHLGPVGA